MITTTTGIAGASERRRRSKNVLADGLVRPKWPERIIKGLVLLIFCLLIIMPFVGVLSTSLSSPAAVNAAGGFVLLPTHGIDLTAYRSILAGGTVVDSLVVSGFVTVVGTAISLALTCALGWALSRRGAIGNKQLLLLVLISLLFNPGLIPSYLVVQQFGLLNSLWSLIIPTSVSAFNVVVVRSFFVGLPTEVLEAARIDGASEWKLFRYIGLPLSKAVISVIGLFYGVGYWNSFFNALLYINDASKWPLQLVLRSYVVNGATLGLDAPVSSEIPPPQTSIQMAILMISIIPILCVYPFIQRNFAKGVLTGAVKG